MSDENGALLQAEAGPSSVGSAKAASTPGTRAASPGPAQTAAAVTEAQNKQQLRRPASHGRLSKLMLPGRSRAASIAHDASPVTAFAGESAMASGRTTPEQRRRTARAAAQSLLANDGRYKKFASQVDRCLQSFDNINEWADFISFLSRLLKTPSPPYNEIPKKLIIAKRLAQCLNPALPSGVHTRALDVYGHVFSIIGPEGLKRDLLVWSSGLFPFFQYAATSVRPTLLNLYETYYLPLGQDLRPAAKAMILALLPGLEEETGDFFDRVLALLNTMSGAVSQQFFLQNVFLVLISSPASRLAALNYLSRQLTEVPEELAKSSDVGLLIRGVAAVLGDQNMLVRRGGLDLLLRILPLDGTIFRESTPGDRDHLVRAVSAVVLQRDVSLSRRVYTWFLSADESVQVQGEYFKKHGLEPLSSTLESDMSRLLVANDVAEAQQPFKTFLSLLDKWEIGQALSTRLAIPALQIIHKAATEPEARDVHSTVTAVYDDIEPSVLWKQLYDAAQRDFDDKGTEHLVLIDWLLSAVTKHDHEVLTIHAPLLLSKLLENIASDAPPPTRTEALRVANALLAMIPDSVFANAKATDSDEGSLIETVYEKDSAEEVLEQRVKSELAPRVITVIFKDSEQGLNDGWTSEALVLANKLAQKAIDRELPPLSSVDTTTWMVAVLRRLKQVRSFAVVEGLVDLTLRGNRSKIFDPPVDITADAVMSVVLDSLFRYLRADAALYHTRAVELIWEFNLLAEVHTLESVIARRMNSVTHRTEAFEAFGVLWRHSDDSMLPGEIFHVPMFMVLEGLKSDDPQKLRASETWMRCNVKSYFRMLDPLVRRILNASRATKSKFDSSQVQYYVSSLTSLFRFGGQGLSKACQSTEVSKSLNAQLVTTAEARYPNTHNYLELLAEMMTSLLKEDGNDPSRLRMQTAVLELLMFLVSRGDLSPVSLNLIKTTLVSQLLLATQQRRLTLQNSMLHLLHSTITAGQDRRQRGHRVTSSTFSLPEKGGSTVPPVEDPVAEFDRSLVDMIKTGVSSSGNRPILQHWIDFVLMIIPYFDYKPLHLRSLSDAFCEQLRETMLTLHTTFTSASINDQAATMTEAEPIMLIGVVERLALVLGAKSGSRRSEERDKHERDGGGLLGYLPTVFSVEAPPDLPSKLEAARYLDNVMSALLVLWTVTREELTTAHKEASFSAASQTQIMTRTRERAQKALEKLFKGHASEVVASAVVTWAKNSDDITDSAIFDCLDNLAPSAQKIVDLVCEHMNGKGRGSISDSTNPVLPAFLEAYVSQLEGPIAVQVWNALYAYAREVLSQSGSGASRAQLFPVLRILTVLGQIVSTTSALEDRRLRRDLQDTYMKILDAVLSGVAKGGEATTWERDGQLSADTASIQEKQGRSSGSPSIYSFVGANVVRNLRTFLTDNDRVLSACSAISQSLVVPKFRRHRFNDDATVTLLREMAKIPAAAKAWRPPLAEAFNDNRFFKVTPTESEPWKPLVCALMDSDKERFTELIGRIAAAPSANIFTNREAETVARSLNLRRLSFVLLAAERNHYLPQLPMIQEKLVEILRNHVVSPRVHSEVYLCLRVLMCRISPQHLTQFWPVILTELLRVFESTMDELPEDGSDDVTLVLAACKFLDLLLVIQSEDFQVHQWIFVTDTTDAAYPPDQYSPEALMDRLAEILMEHSSMAKPVEHAVEIEPYDITAATPRRPQLSGVKSIASIYQLQPFFARASIGTFDGVYADAGVDWDAIEEGITGEICEGNVTHRTP